MNNKETSRRNFITTAGKASIAAGLSLTVLPSLAKSFENQEEGITTTFTQQPLPYTYEELEPIIDSTTMQIHYSKHAATYLKNLNEAVAAEIKATNKQVALTSILQNISKYSSKMRNNAGGHYNHEMFWQCMSKKSSNKPTTSGKLDRQIIKTFGSVDAFKTQFAEAAKTRFGSGWAWLIVTADNKLKICSTPNQDNPLMDVAEVKGKPILCLDVWEHAYYLKYQNKRADYITNWFTIINWNYVEKIFEKAWK